eukprot:3249173-Pyramimonas_sp.AAC.1
MAMAKRSRAICGLCLRGERAGAPWRAWAVGCGARRGPRERRFSGWCSTTGPGVCPLGLGGAACCGADGSGPCPPLPGGAFSFPP